MARRTPLLRLGVAALAAGLRPHDRPGRRYGERGPVRRAGGGRALRRPGHAPLVRHLAVPRPARRPVARRADARGEDLAARRRRALRRRRRRGRPHRHQRRHRAARDADDLLLRRPRGPLREGDRDAVADRARRDVRPANGRAMPGHRRRGAPEGQRRRLRAHRRHRAHAARGPRVRELRRGSLPLLRLAVGVDPGGPGGPDRQRQALRRQQPGGDRPGSDEAPRLGRRSAAGNRMRIDARVDERTMREIYLPSSRRP